MISELSVRLLVLHLVGGGKKVLDGYREVRGRAWAERQVLKDNSISVDDAGGIRIGR